MKIDEQIGEGVHARFLVSFEERKLTDILAIDENDRSDERGFAAVARCSCSDLLDQYVLLFLSR